MDAAHQSFMAAESCMIQAPTKKDMPALGSTGYHKMTSKPIDRTLTQEPTHESPHRSAFNYTGSILMKRKDTKSQHTNTGSIHTKSLAFVHIDKIKRPGQGTTTTPC
jgi:hypothetical protein